MKYSIVTFILIYLFAGCKNEYPEDPLDYFESKQEITAETIELDNELHGIPAWSIVYDYPLIVVAEIINMLDKKFFLINLEDKSLKKFINNGRGDCEFIMAISSSINAKEKTFTFFENIKKAYYKIHLDSLQSSGNSYERCPEKIEIPFDNNQAQSRFYTDLKPIDYRYYLGYKSEVTDSMYTVIDTEKDTSYHFCSFPKLPGLAQNEIKSGNQIFRGNVFIAPNKHKIALISQPTLIEILDWKEGIISRKKSIEFFRYQFTIDYEYKSIRRGFANKEGFLIGDVTDKYIYVGYSGHTNKEMLKMGVFPSVFYVLVFDWDGNPVKRYDLNRTITGMVVDKDDSGMYGISLGSPEIPQINLVHYKFNHLE